MVLQNYSKESLALYYIRKPGWTNALVSARYLDEYAGLLPADRSKLSATTNDEPTRRRRIKDSALDSSYSVLRVNTLHLGTYFHRARFDGLRVDDEVQTCKPAITREDKTTNIFIRG